MFEYIVLKIGMSKHAGARHFLFLHLLHLHRPPFALLVVENPLESAQLQSGEEGGELPPPSMGCFFRGFPLCLTETVLNPQMFVDLSAVPILPVGCGVFPRS